MQACIIRKIIFSNLNCTEHTIKIKAAHTLLSWCFLKRYISPSAVITFVTFFKTVTIATFMYFKLQKIKITIKWQSKSKWNTSKWTVQHPAEINLKHGSHINVFEILSTTRTYITCLLVPWTLHVYPLN